MEAIVYLVENYGLTKVIYHCTCSQCIWSLGDVLSLLLFLNIRIILDYTGILVHVHIQCNCLIGNNNEYRIEEDDSNLVYLYLLCFLAAGGTTVRVLHPVCTYQDFMPL